MLPQSRIWGLRLFSVSSVQCRRPRIDISHEVHGIIKWVRPEKLKVWEPERSCDLKPFPTIDPNLLKLEYRPFASIIDGVIDPRLPVISALTVFPRLPPEKRKLFTVGLGRRRDAFNVIMEDTLDSVRRHKYDTESYEYKIASLTIKIRNLQQILQTDLVQRRHGGFRKATKEMTDKRKQYLNRLKNLDYKRFEWIIHSLSILYKPQAPVREQVTRKGSMRKLTEIYCEAIRRQKMDAYKAELESQKIPFLEEKLATLRQIKSDEEAMRIPSSVDEDIDKTVKQLEQVKNSHIVLEPVPEDQKRINQ